MMTVQEVIDELLMIEDKSVQAFVSDSPQSSAEACRIVDLGDEGVFICGD